MQYGNIFTTAWDVYATQARVLTSSLTGQRAATTKGGTKQSLSARRVTGSRARTLASGVYGPDGGWFYRYNAINGAIMRSHPASGRRWETVAQGSNAHRAISKLLPKLGRKSDTTVNKLLRAASDAIPLFTPAPTVTMTAPMIAMPTEAATPSPRPEWLVPAAVVGSATLLILFAFRPRRR